ncbi:unnamed protein product, partial [Pylaiella littoralis]
QRPRSFQEPSRDSSGVMKMLRNVSASVHQRVSQLKNSLIPSGKERLHSWNEAREISIVIARSLVEFPLSEAAAQEGTAAAIGCHPPQIPAQLKAAGSRGVSFMRQLATGRPTFRGPKGATGRTHHLTSAAVEARGDVGKISVDGAVYDRDNNSSNNYNRGKSRYGGNTRSSNSDGPRSSTAPGDRYDGDSSWVSGDEILRTLGGGYLAVTALCTLSRAVALQGMMKQAADASKVAPSSNNNSSNGHDDYDEAFGHFGATQEVIELVSLLASLFRLGSPTSQVTMAGGEKESQSQLSPVPSLAAAAAGAGVDGTSITGLPPTQAEVEDALAAGQCTALFRRGFSTDMPHSTLLPLPQYWSRGSFFGGATRGKPGGRGQGPGNGQAAADHHLPTPTQNRHVPYTIENHCHTNPNNNERESRPRERESWPNPALPQALPHESSGGRRTATNTPQLVVAAPRSAATLPLSSGRQKLAGAPQESETSLTAGLERMHRQFSAFHVHSTPDKAP